MSDAYPRRLIEVDLPIKRISAHARREKSIRHGHISTLHIWWARRPLAACRAVICAALWPDPADPLCPVAFVTVARAEMQKWTAHDRQTMLSAESRQRFEKARQKPALFNDAVQLRGALLDFIADFANWDNSTVREYLDTSRALTQAAHEALGGAPGTRPLVVDPFCGGGSIPLEALRVGADAFASDLNPIPVLLNKVVLEYIPKYGQRLADEVRKWGEWIKREAEKELAEFYPNDADGATPIAYLWARTIQCEGPGCGAEVPLIRSLWLAKKANRSVAMQLLPRPRAKRVDFQIIFKQRGGWVDQDDPKAIIENPTLDGPVKRGSATCPCCGYTTPVEKVRTQLRARRGGTGDALPYCKVVKTRDGSTEYGALTKDDFSALKRAKERLAMLAENGLKVPSLALPPDGALGFRVQKYGMSEWADLFLSRQQLQLLSYLGVVQRVKQDDAEFGHVLRRLFGLTVSKLSSFSSSLCVWRNVRSCVAQTFGRQTLSMVWDFGEMNPFAESAGDFGEAIEYLAKFIEHVAASTSETGTAQEADAAASPLADDSADLFFTDPPYYDAIPYHHLSEFFALWLGSSGILALDEKAGLKRRAEECIVDEGLGKSREFFETKMTKALAEGRRVAKPSAVGVIVFGHKSTAGWEAQLGAMLQAGWIVTSSWPIDTERSGRLRAQDSAALGSSIQITCRPRVKPDGSLGTEEVGDWRDVLAELPRRIHDWMPRLAEEGVVGADAIFACLGPALEIFSRYSRVEKASGEAVPLKEYLEQVWAAVAKEALAMIFSGADATGFEEDARLTAMWLWTLSTGGQTTEDGGQAEESEAEDEEGSGNKSKGGFVLEFDAARKIAQGLGAHLEDLASLVAVEGETARLLPVADRSAYLIGRDVSKLATAKTRKPHNRQIEMGQVVREADVASGKDPDADATSIEGRIQKHGQTVLDRVHQSMILFAAGRSEALKRFLVEDGAGNDIRFWTLAQALSALYPSNTDEKRWVDGVLARKKGLGF
jgi:putative DNA methylase